jgi:hypothetical protein
MTGLFGKSKRRTEETVLVVDIESASVAAALVVLAPGQLPKLFAESRVILPMSERLIVGALAKEVEEGASSVIGAVSLTAARLRNAGGADSKLKTKLVDMGQVSRAVIFFSPPWTAPEQARGGLVWRHEPALFAHLKQEIEGVFGKIPITPHAFGEAAVGALHSLFEQSEEFLLCTVTGEVTELLCVEDGVVRAHATIPTGLHLPVRTLKSHAGLSTHEAHSALALERERDDGHAMRGVTAAAAGEFATRFAEAVNTLATEKPMQEVLVVAIEPQGEWFARALGQVALAKPFTSESTVRALRTHHLVPYITARASTPDLFLITEGIFIGILSPGVY